MTDTESIVRAVAACEPMTMRDDDMTGEWYQCGFCDAIAEVVRRAPYDYVPGEAEHTETCPWRRAHEWVERNP